MPRWSGIPDRRGQGTSVKLIKRDENQCTFQIGRRERDMFFALLRRYPVVISGHFQSRNPPITDEAKKNQELLKDALAEQQLENRKHLEQLLAEPGRFHESETGFTFRISYSELEWFLQLLNDIRVGSWIQLGQPDVGSAGQIALTEQNLQLTWSMEMAALFQHSLLEAAQASE